MPTRRNPNDSPEKRPARGRETPEQAGNEVPHDTRGDGRTDGLVRPRPRISTPDDHPGRQLEAKDVKLQDASGWMKSSFHLLLGVSNESN
jgi:hypothetical protein